MISERSYLFGTVRCWTFASVRNIKKHFVSVSYSVRLTMVASDLMIVRVTFVSNLGGMIP